MCDIISRIGPAHRPPLVAAVLATLRFSNSSHWPAENLERIGAALTGEQARAALDVVSERFTGADRIRGLAALEPEARSWAIEEAVAMLAQLRDNDQTHGSSRFRGSRPTWTRTIDAAYGGS
jgi:hypothetical protein